MRKILSLAVLLCIFLTACDNSPPATSGPNSSTPPSSSPKIQTPDAGPAYEEGLNPYNVQTAVTDEYVFVVQEGSISRVNRSDNTVEQIVRNQENGPRIAGAPSIAVYGNHIYYMTANNILDVTAGRAETLEMGIWRAALDGSNAKQVATTEGGVYQLFLYDGYLVGYTFNALEELSPDDSFRFFKPDSAAETLEEIPLMELGSDRLAAISRFVNPQQEPQLLWDRLRLMGNTPYYTAIKANDAYYYLDATQSTPALYRVPLTEYEEPVSVELLPKVAESMDRHAPEARRLVNYNAEWLYFRDDTSLFRIRKDGREYQLCIQDFGYQQGFIDVVGSHVFYGEAGSKIYMAPLEGGEAPVQIP